MGQEMVLFGKHNTAKVFTHNVDEVTVGQVINFLNQPFTDGQTVRIMPDTHAGKGAVIGTTMTVTDKIVPNLVGVDIGCGVLAYEVSSDTFNPKDKDHLEFLDGIVRKLIPSGQSVRGKAHPSNKYIAYDKILAPFDLNRAQLSLGTLGGGNHFIELNYSENTGKMYLVVHSGSRHLGVKVAKYHQDKAIAYHSNHEAELRELIIKLKNENKHSVIEQEVKAFKQRVSLNMPKELTYLEGQLMQDYINDLKIAQEFADHNRHVMLNLIVEAMGWNVTDVIHSVHNYLDMDDMILRKGAIASYANEKIIVPINMRDGSIIATGKSNKDWNYSAPHGAGRIMSRSQAKREVDLEDFQETMKDVFSTSVSTATLDESPFAYKSMEEIVENTKDTMDIIEIIKPVYNFKASD